MAPVHGMGTPTVWVAMARYFNIVKADFELRLVGVFATEESALKVCRQANYAEDIDIREIPLQ